MACLDALKPIPDLVKRTNQPVDPVPRISVDALDTTR